MGLILNRGKAINNSGSMSNSVMVPKERFRELEKKEKDFEKMKAEKEKTPFRQYSYKRLTEEGEDAEKLFKF